MNTEISAGLLKDSVRVQISERLHNCAQLCKRSEICTRTESFSKPAEISVFIVHRSH